MPTANYVDPFFLKNFFISFYFMERTDNQCFLIFPFAPVSCW